MFWIMVILGLVASRWLHRTPFLIIIFLLSHGYWTHVFLFFCALAGFFLDSMDGAGAESQEEVDGDEGTDEFPTNLKESLFREQRDLDGLPARLERESIEFAEAMNLSPKQKGTVIVGNPIAFAPSYSDGCDRLLMPADDRPLTNKEIMVLADRRPKASLDDEYGPIPLIRIGDDNTTDLPAVDDGVDPGPDMSTEAFAEKQQVLQELRRNLDQKVSPALMAQLK